MSYVTHPGETLDAPECEEVLLETGVAHDDATAD